ncbi:alpha/beta hydrolase [Variovorax sp. J22R133]|uniref:alpha/beta fold hydrolase n=1 Tax=Variovorax brevis TaxID=3053503 RepID=UPI002578E2A5|nr:alpha/beta hydrolase [Variovorax sp. J22R133]MDM0118144.1 alpha/beta hydrolase [Variovorax sp. J22R133]
MTSSHLKDLATSRGALATVALATATAAWTAFKARRAEREHPPKGLFANVDGIRLHYVDRGAGPPVVLLHGNAVTLDDFHASGLIERLAKEHRVIAIDRPGFGHSDRSRNRLWTPAAQAKLIRAALAKLGVERPVVLGHSMGTMVAMAMALEYPDDVGGLVLLGGYYYPTARLDALLTTPVALPVLGDVMRYTVTAMASRAMMNGAVKAMFSPNAVPADFFPALSREMMLRPVQLRANAEDAVFMVPAALASSKRHGELRMPVTIIAGADDKVVDPVAHSRRLHGDLPQSTLIEVPAAGHMVHYVVPGQIVAAVSAGGEIRRPAAANGRAGDLQTGSSWQESPPRRAQAWDAQTALTPV